MMNNPSPFDDLAETYDADFSASEIGKLQRKRVWSYLATLLIEKKGSLNILEINCGTGEDSIQLANMGHAVTATDASAAMIRKAKEKLCTLGSGASVQFSVCPFNQLADQFKNKKFDLVISNFGGLNCIPASAIKSLGEELSNMLKPQGSLFLVLMGNCCIREMVHFGIRGNIKKALSRLNSPVDFTVNGKTLPIYYHAPGALAMMLSPNFYIQKKYPIGLFVPPSYFEKIYSGKAARLKKLESLERRYCYSFLSSFGDHYCAIFNKRGPQQ